MIFYPALSPCKKKIYNISVSSRAGVAELADALDSKSGIRKDVWVRTPPPVKALFSYKITRRAFYLLEL